MSIFAFDKGMAMYPLAAAIRAQTRGASGLHFTVAADDDRLAFCPLQFLETKSDRAWAMAVSYTHQDVYKRQTGYWSVKYAAPKRWTC